MIYYILFYKEIMTFCVESTICSTVVATYFTLVVILLTLSTHLLFAPRHAESAVAKYVLSWLRKRL